MARLSRAIIVGTALELLNEAGLEGVTTRALAVALNVKSPALYWHFEHMRALLDAMADAMLASIDEPAAAASADGGSLALIRRAHAVRRALLSFRDGGMLLVGSGNAADAALGFDKEAEALRALGMSEAAAVRTVTAVKRFTIGSVCDEQGFAGRTSTAVPDAERDTAFDFGVRSLVAGAIAGGT